jgi:hypothetical protein
MDFVMAIAVGGTIAAVIVAVALRIAFDRIGELSRELHGVGGECDDRCRRGGIRMQEVNGRIAMLAESLGLEFVESPASLELREREVTTRKAKR